MLITTITFIARLAIALVHTDSEEFANPAAFDAAAT